MSLILGVHLLERICLISDTRASSIDGSTHSDDLIKAFKLNDKISAVAAGDGLAASYCLNRLKALTNEDTTADQLVEMINNHLKIIISEYVNKTGRYGNVVIIFAAFNKESKKLIEASLLGKALSAGVIKHQGKTVNQKVDKRLLNAFGQLAGKGKGDYISVDNVQDSRLFSLTVDLRACTVSNIINAECYQYAMYYPPHKSSEVIELPEEIISLLEFRAKNINMTGEDIIYEDSEILMSFVNNIIKKNNFTNVGGNLLTLIQFPVGAIFPTGDIGAIRNGVAVKIGRFYVSNGKMMYELEDGTTGEYRHLENLSDLDLKDMMI